MTLHRRVVILVAAVGAALGLVLAVAAPAMAADQAYLRLAHLSPDTPKVDVYVTNGGYGGVQYALRQGVPIVTSGGKEDKPEVAARVAWSGVGRRLRSETPSPKAVHAAVHAVLGDSSYRSRARAVAESMARSGGVDALLAIVDGLAAGTHRA